MRFENAYGALLGVLVGDAAGAPLEFCEEDISDDIVKQCMRMPGGGVLRVGPGQITDDGELTLSLARALINNNPDLGLPLERMASNYAEWMTSEPFDVGNTCRRAFSISKLQIEKISSKNGSLHSFMMHRVSDVSQLMQSNGSLMRIIPMAIWSASQPVNTIAHNSRMDALLSHPNQICQDCNALYCIAVCHLLNHPNDAKGAIKSVKKYISESAVHPTVVEWFEKSVSISELDCTVSIGHVKYAFWLSFFFLRQESPFSEAIHLTLLKGGDTDTNAAIVGGMIGALHGVEGVPQYMREPLESFDCTKPNRMGYVRPERFRTNCIKEIVHELIAAKNVI